MIEFGLFQVKDFVMFPPISSHHPLILASGSRYRADLLARLHLPFEGIAADIDETPLPNESAKKLSERLALVKARAVAKRVPQRWVLGSDQAAEVEDRILDKPGTRERAAEQLAFCSGREVRFFTAVALICGDQVHTSMDLTRVRFRELGAAEISRYLDAESVLDCAGSFKCEGLGISLFERIDSQDPTGLIGLPLIAVRRLLMSAGVALP